MPTISFVGNGGYKVFGASQTFDFTGVPVDGRTALVMTSAGDGSAAPFGGPFSGAQLNAVAAAVQAGFYAAGAEPLLHVAAFPGWAASATPTFAIANAGDATEAGANMFSVLGLNPADPIGAVQWSNLVDGNVTVAPAAGNALLAFYWGPNAASSVLSGGGGAWSAAQSVIGRVSMYCRWIDAVAGGSSAITHDGVLSGIWVVELKAASGGAAQDLAGDAAGAAAVAGSLTDAKNLAGAAAGTAAAAATLTKGDTLAGGAQGQATVAGSIGTKRFRFELRRSNGVDLFANETGLWYLWWANFADRLTQPPDAWGTGLATDENGVFDVAAPGDAFAGADQGYGVVSNQTSSASTSEAAYCGSFDVQAT